MTNRIPLLIALLSSFCVYAQTVIPLGISKDSIYPSFIYNTSASVRKHSFYYYKPASYNPSTSPIVFAIHGSGGNGLGPINDLITIANRRQALVIAPNYDYSDGGCVNFNEATYLYVDSIDFCGFKGPATDILKEVYKHVLSREARTTIPSYMIGFSAGGQFVSRYMLIRQAYPDSIPLKMSVSANPYYYAFPTDTFNGTPMPWLCGLLFSPNPLGCSNNIDFYTFDCTEHIKQYYNENYGVLIGNADLTPLSDNACAMAQGSNRYQRAQTFYNFGLLDAPNYSTPFNWQYKEVPGVGHNQGLVYNTKDLPIDSFTIAEKLLFDSPYYNVASTAPIADFFANNTLLYLPNAIVTFSNTSTQATNYVWDFGDGTTSTQINPTHTYTNTGYYMVQLKAINSGGCDNWKVKRHYIKVESVTGNNEIDNNNLLVSLSPNPVSDGLTINLSGLSNTSSTIDVMIYNYYGELVSSVFKENMSKCNSQLTMDTKELLNGLYIVKIIRDKKNTKIQKLIVSH